MRVPVEIPLRAPFTVPFRVPLGVPLRVPLRDTLEGFGFGIFRLGFQVSNRESRGFIGFQDRGSGLIRAWDFGLGVWGRGFQDLYMLLA